MPEQIVAQVEFDLARDTDQDPPHQKLKDALTERNGYQCERISDDLVPCDALIQIIDRASDDLRKEDPDQVIEEKHQPAPEELDAILVNVRLERIELFEHDQKN